MRIFAFFIFSLLLTALLSLTAGKFFGDQFWPGGAVSTFIAVFATIYAGILFKFRNLDTIAVSSFPIISFAVPAITSSQGYFLFSILTILIFYIGFSSIYLFLRVFGRL